MTDDTDPSWLFDLHDDDQGRPRTLADGLTTRIFAGERSMLSVVRVEPYSEGELHSHPEEQWGILLEGECVRIQGDEAVHATAGNFWHTPAGVEHAVRTAASGALVLDVFSPPRPAYREGGEGYDAGSRDDG